MANLQQLPRGWRNCNPGNIKKSAERFRGEVDGLDTVFKTFRSMAWGFRALFMILHTYIVKYNLRTIRQIVERWAPSGENNTEDYIYTLCEKMHMEDDDELHFTPITMPRLATAIATIECGRAPKRADVEMGWSLCEKDLREINRRKIRNLPPIEGLK